MHFSARSTVGALSAALLAPLVSAQTPSGFSPSASSQLSVTYGAKAVSPAGLTLTKEDTASIPSIASGSGALTGSKFLFMMLDLDVPIKSGNSITGRQTLLHALVGNFTAGSDGKLTTTTADAAPATYIGPSPPAENPAKPHRYTQLLFEQPDNFAIPSSQAAAVQKRVGFDPVAFISAAGLQAPIQGNFFLVVNNSQVGAAAESSSTGKAEASASASATGKGQGSKGGEASKTVESGRAASTGALPTRSASGTGNRQGGASATGSGAAKGTGSAKSTGAARGTGTGAAGSRTTAPLNPAMFTGAADMNNVRNKFGAVVAAGAVIFAL